MTQKHIYLTEFGSGLPLIHWALQKPSEFVIHTQNSSLERYIRSLQLTSNNEWGIEPSAHSIYIGTSSEPRLYDNLIRNANQLGIKTHAYFDSWVNYRKRINIEPTEILVSDRWAFELAKETYPQSQIVNFENFYFRHLAESYVAGTNTSVLYISSPTNSYNNVPAVTHNLNCVCIQLPKITALFEKEVIYRKHPGYEVDSCESYLIAKNLAKVSTNPDSLLDDLKLAEYVVGPVSQVHYFAERLGIPAFVTNKPNSEWCGPKIRSLNL